MKRDTSLIYIYMHTHGFYSARVFFVLVKNYEKYHEYPVSKITGF